jgi:hypothetical protein
MAGESVVDVPPKLSARVRVLSSGNARKRTMGSTPSPPRSLAASRHERPSALDPEAASAEVLRLLSERREDVVAEQRTPGRLTACTGFYETSSPAG